MLDINLDWLRSLAVLAKHLNFSRAADELGYTQQALSYQILQLEEKLGVHIFERLPQGLELTASGKNILHELPVFFDTLESTYQKLNGFNSKGDSKHLNIYFSNGWDCDDLTVSFTARLKSEYPYLKIKFKWVLQERLESMLLENKDSIGLGYLPLESSQLEVHEVYASPGVLAAHPDNKEEPPLINYNQEQVFPFSKILKDLHYDYSVDHILEPRLPSSHLMINSTAEYRILGIENKGTVFTHYKAIEGAVKEGCLKVFEFFPDLLCRGYISWHKERQHQVSGDTLVRFFKDIN